MRALAGRTICSVLVYLILLPVSHCPVRARSGDAAYIAEIDAWHAERIARLTGEDGWLTLVGLHPLHEGINTVGSAPDRDVRLITKAPARVGTLDDQPNGVVLKVEKAVPVFVSGREGGPEQENQQSTAGRQPVTELTLTTDVEGQPTVLELGSLLFHVISRGDRLFLRVKDKDSEVRRNFIGVDRFPVGPRWRVKARLEAHDPPQTVAVPNVLGQVNQSPSPGTLVFVLAGFSCHLVPVGEPGESLFIVFADATTGTRTYGGGHFPPPIPCGRFRPRPV